MLVGSHGITSPRLEMFRSFSPEAVVVYDLSSDRIAKLAMLRLNRLFAKHANRIVWRVVSKMAVRVECVFHDSIVADSLAVVKYIIPYSFDASDSGLDRRPSGNVSAGVG